MGSNSETNSKSADGLDSPPVQHYGSRLLPQVVYECARLDPRRVYATVPRSSDLSHGFRNVSMLELSKAVNRVAYWLERIVGRSKQFETVAYMGPFDLRYAILFLAFVKCGYKVTCSFRIS